LGFIALIYILKSSIFYPHIYGILHWGSATIGSCSCTYANISEPLPTPANICARPRVPSEPPAAGTSRPWPPMYKWLLNYSARPDLRSAVCVAFALLPDSQYINRWPGSTPSIPTAPKIDCSSTPHPHPWGPPQCICIQSMHLANTYITDCH